MLLKKNRIVFPQASRTDMLHVGIKNAKQEQFSGPELSKTLRRYSANVTLPRNTEVGKVKSSC